MLRYVKFLGIIPCVVDSSGFHRVTPAASLPWWCSRWHSTSQPVWAMSIQRQTQISHWSWCTKDCKTQSIKQKSPITWEIWKLQHSMVSSMAVLVLTSPSLGLSGLVPLKIHGSLLSAYKPMLSSTFELTNMYPCMIPPFWRWATTPLLNGKQTMTDVWEKSAFIITHPLLLFFSCKNTDHPTKIALLPQCVLGNF